MASQFKIGDQVRLVALPPYFKTADPMPMLRPPDTLQVGAEGTVLSHRPGGYWGVRFEQGAFLLDGQFLAAAAAPQVDSSNCQPPDQTLLPEKQEHP
ncbi:MAG: regulatory protein SipA [Nodosilinea sp.]